MSAATVDQIKDCLYELFLAGFNFVEISATRIVVAPRIGQSKEVCDKLSIKLIPINPEGHIWPIHWDICHHIFKRRGAGGSFDYDIPEVPVYLSGEYSRDNWQETLDNKIVEAFTNNL